jgi:4a-hydroxytetrahydrobiopterin dehydratase
MHDPGLPDWRLLLDRLHATFVAADLAAAIAFVGEIAEVASRTMPDADLRPDGRIHLSLPGTATDAARAISGVAGRRSLPAEAVEASVVEVAIDAMDIPRIKPFWQAVLGYVDDGDVALVHPHRLGAPFWFQQMDEPRTERNRFHIDVTVPHDVAVARVDAALAAGGTLVSDAAARSWWVLADAEGNEACVCTWQDRG